MATTAFTAFLPEILPHVPGCADLVAENAVRNACIEFCSDSLFWQETRDAVSVTSASFPYTLAAPTGARVVEILSLSLDSTILRPIALDTLDSHYYDWRSKTANVSTHFYQANPEVVAVFPALEAGVTSSLRVRVAYAPKRDATGVDSFVYQQWLEELAAGALARLMATPGQSYSNPQLAGFYTQIFNKAKAEATAEANKSYNRAALAVEMRPLA